MQFVWRPLKLTDIEACSLLTLEDETGYDTETRALLPDLWRELLTGGFAETTLLEDWDQPAGRRLVGFSFIVFLTDAFVAATKSSPLPYINRRIVDAWRAGQSPLLDAAAVRAANSGSGLNQHTFHQAYPGMLPAPPPLMLESVIDAFLQLSSGYQIKESTIEVYGPQQLQMNLTGGFRLRNDYEAFYRHPGADPPPERRPFLIGISREESAASPGSVVSLIFNYRAPRFFFRPSEQEMLRRALWGETDEELARSMFLSVSAVRKRWLAIYERVAQATPSLFPPPALPTSQEKTRGLEKRRVLLHYLRSHWEELRPLHPSASRPSATGFHSGGVDKPCASPVY